MKVSRNLRLHEATASELVRELMSRNDVQGVCVWREVGPLVDGDYEASEWVMSHGRLDAIQLANVLAQMRYHVVEELPRGCGGLEAA